MSDFFTPSYWYGAGPDFSGLANAQASQGQTNNYLANQQAQLAQANSFDPYASGGGFGAQTNYYSGLGASYERATGGFGTRGHTTNPGRGYSGGGIGGENARDELARTMASGSYPSGTVTRGRRLAPASAGDPYFMSSNPAGFNPSTSGGIGSDMRYGSQNKTPQLDFKDLWRDRIAPQIDMPPSTVTVPQQQGQNWYGMSTASS